MIGWVQSTEETCPERKVQRCYVALNNHDKEAQAWAETRPGTHGRIEA